MTEPTLHELELAAEASLEHFAAAHTRTVQLHHAVVMRLAAEHDVDPAAVAEQLYRRRIMESVALDAHDDHLARVRIDIARAVADRLRPPAS